MSGRPQNSRRARGFKQLPSPSLAWDDDGPCSQDVELPNMISSMNRSSRALRATPTIDPEVDITPAFDTHAPMNTTARNFEHREVEATSTDHNDGAAEAGASSPTAVNATIARLRWPRHLQWIAAAAVMCVITMFALSGNGDDKVHQAGQDLSAALDASLQTALPLSPSSPPSPSPADSRPLPPPLPSRPLRACRPSRRGRPAARPPAL